MPRFLGTLRRFGTELAIVLASVTLLGLVWGISLRMVADVERKGVDSAFQEARGLARLFASQWSERLQRIDSLHSLGRLILRRQLAGEAGATELLEELRRAVNLSGGDVLQVGAVDAAGTALWSTLPLPPGPVSIANREHYQAVAQEGRDRFIGRPVRGIVSGRWTIQFTEAVRDPDRTLRGLTVVSVDAGLIRALTRELDMADRGVITISRDDGVVLARSEDRGIGEVINPLTSYHRAVLQTGASEWRGAGPLDGVRRFYAARAVPESGMIVSVGLDEAHLIAPVQSAVAQIHRSAAMLSVAIVALAAGAAVGLRWHRGLGEERQRSSELAKREALLRQLAEQASDIISLLDADRCIIYVNPAFRTVLGFDPRQREGHVFGSAVMAQDRPVVQVALAALADGAGSQRFECRVDHADGRPRWLETEMVAVSGTRDSSSVCYVAISRDITRRKQDEDALQAVREQLDALLRLGPGILYRLNIGPTGDRRLTVVSDSPLLRRMGYALDQVMVPRFFQEHLYAEDVPVVAAALAHCLHTGQSVAEYRYPTTAGELRWLRDDMRSAGQDQGGCVIVGYITDITEEREAREELQTMIRLGPGSLYRSAIGPDGERRVTYSDDRIVGLFGYTREQAEARGFFSSRLSPLDTESEAEAVSRCLRTGHAVVEYRFPTAAGEMRWIRNEMRGAGTEGDRRLIVGYLTDITAERENREQLEELHRLGPGMLYRLTIGPGDRIRATIPSTGLLHRMGYTAEEMAPGFFLSRVYPQDAAVLRDALERCVRAGQVVVEYRFQTAAGEWRWLRDEMRVMDRREGQTVIVSFMSDITAEHAAKARVQQAERLATLGEVATGIAHEMNQPLTAIAMAAENGLRGLEREDAGGSPTAAKLRRIVDQAHRLGTVINHIRLFGRSETAMSVEFSLEQVVQEALLLVESRLHSSDVTVSLDVPADLPRLRATRVLLEQVLMNLIVNACDAYGDAPETGGNAANRVIRIVGRGADDGIRLTIADRAGGIPPGVIDRIFDPFFTTKPPGKGTGLGLSISFATVSEMGGQISVRNEAGGAVFEIRLPLPDAAIGPVELALARQA